MKLKQIPMQDALKKGWELTKENFLFFVGLLIINFIFSYSPYKESGSTSSLFSGRGEYQPIVEVLLTIIRTVVEMGTIRIVLKLIDNKKPSYAEFFNQLNRFLPFFLASILYIVLVGAGLILFIIPGIIFALTYQYYSYLILDKNMGIFEAFSKSAEITRGVRWQLFLFGLLLILVMIAGFLALGVGLFVAMPVTMVAQAYVYRYLVKHSHKEIKEESDEAIVV
ncbi:MAG TPA: DUF975 family protein [Patescibacteria group bacterium]